MDFPHVNYVACLKCLSVDYPLKYLLVFDRPYLYDIHFIYPPAYSINIYVYHDLKFYLNICQF